MPPTTGGTPIVVPLGYPTATIFLHESGSKASASQFFVVGGLKLRSPGSFQRAVQDVRDRTGFSSEFKFAEINRGSVSAYYALIDQLEQSDALLAGCVVDGRVSANPFEGGRAAWLGHVDVTAQLLVGTINRRELVGVVLDGVSTPIGCSVAEPVKQQVNRRFRNTAIISAVSLDSRSNDVLRVADLVASAIAFERRRALGGGASMSHKAKVALRLRTAFSLDSFDDQRSDRVNIATYKGRVDLTRRPGRAADIPAQGLRSVGS